MPKMERPRKSRIIEAPPSLSDVRGNLEAPEHAPAAPQEEGPIEKIDGRSRRKSGRTVSFATNISPEFRKQLDRVAKEADMLYIEVLEEALNDFERKIQRNKKRSSQANN